MCVLCNIEVEIYIIAKMSIDLTISSWKNALHLKSILAYILWTIDGKYIRSFQ